MSLSRNVQDFPAVVNLNVGGQFYSTALSTLNRHPESMLGAMFSGRFEVSKDKSGNFFIDRDGVLFRYIINYLRTSKLCLPPSFEEFEQLKAEADFFQIPGFNDAVEKLHSNYLKRQAGGCDILELEYSKEKYNYVIKSNGYIRISSTTETLKDLFPNDGKDMKGKMYTGHSYKLKHDGVEIVGANLHLPCYSKVNAILKHLTNHSFELKSTALSRGKDADGGSCVTYILVRRVGRETHS